MLDEHIQVGDIFRIGTALFQVTQPRVPCYKLAIKMDVEASIAHLNCPPTHRRAIRTTNLLERLFGEERRRMRAAGNLFGEAPC